MKLPTARDLKLPEGCRFSNLRKIRLEKGLESACLLQESFWRILGKTADYNGVKWISNAL